MYEGVADDDFPPAEDFVMGPIDLLVALWHLIYVDGKVAGYAQFKKFTSRTWEMHGGILPEYRRLGRQIGRKVLDTGISSLSADKIIAVCPACNPAAQVFNRSIGMKPGAEIKNAYRRHGQFWNVTVFEINKEVQCQSQSELQV